VKFFFVIFVPGIEMLSFSCTMSLFHVKGGIPVLFSKHEVHIKLVGVHTITRFLLNCLV